MNEKLYDSVIFASDQTDNNKVRFCNDLATRIKVLQRDKFTIHDTVQFDRKMTKREIIELLLTQQHLRLCDEDRNAVDDALDILKRKNVRSTSFDDVRLAILDRKTISTEVVE